MNAHNSTSALLPHFHDALQQNFADAVAGHHRSFVTRDPQHDPFVVRELLRFAKDEIFILTKNLSPEVFSPLTIRTVTKRGKAPKFRVLFDRPSAVDRALTEASLVEIADLVSPAGPIELRSLGYDAPMQLIVVDGKHVRMDATPRDPKIVELNAPIRAAAAMKDLRELWSVASPLSLQNGILKVCEPA